MKGHQAGANICSRDTDSSYLISYVCINKVNGRLKQKKQLQCNPLAYSRIFYLGLEYNFTGCDFVVNGFTSTYTHLLY